MSDSNSSDGENSDAERLLYRKAFKDPVVYNDIIEIEASIWRTALAHVHILNTDVVVDDTLLKDICGHFLELPQESLENGISKDELNAYRMYPGSLFAKVKAYHTVPESDSTDASEDSDGTDDPKDNAGTDDSKDRDGTHDSKNNAGKYITSDTFRVSGYDWVIKLYPDGKISSPTDDHFIYVSLFIVLTSHGSNVRALFNLTLLDQSGNGKHRLYRGPCTLKRQGRMWGHNNFLRRERLETLGYLKDDCLLMHCTVGIVKQFNIPITPSDMARNLNYLLETETGCDILLRVGDQTLKAHKVILAAGSPVFKAMFFGLLGNPNMNELELKEVKPSIFKAMLLFIYSNTLPDSMSRDVIEQLLPAADRFGVERLKHLCEAKLSEEINVDTVATTLGFADKHHCSQLKFICLKFASENLEEVMETQGFKYLTEACPLLLSELLQTTEPKAAALLASSDPSLLCGL